MSKEKLLDRVSDALLKAKYIKEKDGHCMPVLMAEIDDGMAIAPLPFKSREEKAKVCKAITGELAKKNCKWYIFVSEAWASVTHKDAEKAKDLMEGKLMPSDDPNHKDVIIVFGEDEEGNKCTMTAVIKSEKDKKIEWGEDTIMDEDGGECYLFKGIFG